MLGKPRTKGGGGQRLLTIKAMKGEGRTGRKLARIRGRILLLVTQTKRSSRSWEIERGKNLSTDLDIYSWGGGNL